MKLTYLSLWEHQSGIGFDGRDCLRQNNLWTCIPNCPAYLTTYLAGKNHPIVSFPIFENRENNGVIMAVPWLVLISLHPSRNIVYRFPTLIVMEREDREREREIYLIYTASISSAIVLNKNGCRKQGIKPPEHDNTVSIGLKSPFNSTV